MTDEQKKYQLFIDLNYYKRKPRYWKQAGNYFGWRRGKLVVGDNEVLKDLQSHTCAVCGSGYDPDIRWLRIGCFYDLTEVSNKFEENKEGFFVLPFCKACRGTFMGILADFIEQKGYLPDPYRNGENIIQYT